MVLIRNATIDDAERILEIYDYYVRNTAITFEYETPTIDEFKERMRTTMKKYPYLVVLKNEIIEGYELFFVLYLHLTVLSVDLLVVWLLYTVCAWQL